VGINGTFLFVRADSNVDPQTVADAVESFHRQHGAALWSRTPLAVEDWYADQRLFGVAVSASREGWMTIADAERRPSHDLAEHLATSLATPVVVSSLYEICDPPEPELCDRLRRPSH
jgi:hypothetical protein